MRNFSLVIILILVIFCSLTSAETEKSLPLTAFFSNDQVSLAELVSGSVGTGFLVYYLPERGVERPSLVVRLHKSVHLDYTVAEIYDAPAGADFVPVRFERNGVRLSSISPTIVMEPLGGWWVRDGVVNYSLKVQINGPVHAIWGGDFQGSTQRIEPSQRAVHIMSHSSEETGLPKWELRQLIPPFPGNSYYRANYAERKCDTPLRIDLGVSPLWPYVAASGNYEQRVGIFHPPIIVDWESGKVTQFSELVTVRNQNCSYSLFSIAPLELDTFNSPNFETPFAFYDLSGEGVGYPNLLLRTERYPAGDEWGGPSPRDIVWNRYSWRNEIGDQLWDYKIEVLGFHPYTSETLIAGGLVRIDAPAYEDFPDWIVEQEWPVVTFIDTEGNSYRSNEGIYEWTPEFTIGRWHMLGADVPPYDEGFSTIRRGFRGEYRTDKTMKPYLYLSPIDSRLHLLGAEGGLWNLGEEEQLKLGNLSEDLYIDHWKFKGPDTQTELINFEDYLLLMDAEGVTLRQVAVPHSLFTMLPPSDKASWEASRKKLEPYEAARRSPHDMHAWLEAFPGPTLFLPGARMNQPSISQDGFSFILELDENVMPEAGSLPSLPRHDDGILLATRSSNPVKNAAFRNLAPGRYVISHNTDTQTWASVIATPPRLDGALEPRTLSAFTPIQLELSVQNSGSTSLSEAATLRIDDEVVKSWNSLPVSGNNTVQESIPWVPRRVGTWEAVLEIGEETISLGSVEIAPGNRATGLKAIQLSVGDQQGMLSLLGLLGLLLTSVYGLGLAWRVVWR